MQTLIENRTKKSKYVFGDSIQVIMSATMIVTDNTRILDLNENTTTLVQDVTSPSDWQGDKYLYDEQTDIWSLCPNWVDPDSA